MGAFSYHHVITKRKICLLVLGLPQCVPLSPVSRGPAEEETTGSPGDAGADQVLALVAEPGGPGVLAGRLWWGLAWRGSEVMAQEIFQRGSQRGRGLTEKSGLALVLSPGHRSRDKATLPGLLRPGLLGSWRSFGDGAAVRLAAHEPCGEQGQATGG